jgi:hypothetical protein
MDICKFKSTKKKEEKEIEKAKTALPGWHTPPGGLCCAVERLTSGEHRIDRPGQTLKGKGQNGSTYTPHSVARPGRPV